MSSRRLRPRGSYEEDEAHISKLFCEVSSDEDTQEDPYGDIDGEYASDGNYEPENEPDSSNTSIDEDEFGVLGLSPPRPSTSISKSLFQAVQFQKSLVELSPNTVSANLPSTYSSPSTSGQQNKAQSPRRALIDDFMNMPADDQLEQRHSSPTIFEQVQPSDAIPLIPLESFDDVNTFSISNQNSEVPAAVDATPRIENHRPQTEQQQPEPEQNTFSISNQNSEVPAAVDATPRIDNNRPQTEQQQPEPEQNIWSTDTAPISDFSFNDSDTGPMFEVTESSKPIDIFKHFLTDDMLQDICNKINAYGKHLCSLNRPHTRNARQKVFYDLTAKELTDFIGLCILLGNLKLPSARKAFSLKDPLWYHPIFPAVMSSRRFEQILRCFTVGEIGAQKYEKVRFFIEQVKTIFQANYKPEKQLSLDESMLMFRGRLMFRVYMKSKRHKYGIKFYVLTTAEGYILNFIVYTGRDTDDDGNVDTKKVNNIVLKLMQPYLMKGHELYMDNFYNSVDLSKKLLQHRTHSTGTLRKNRKGNPDILKTTLKKDEHIWKRNGRIYVSCWKDKRNVCMITTKHHPRLILSRNRHGAYRKKPVEIDEYNKYMSGIDRSDQMISYYSCPRRTIRWYKKIIFHLFDMMLWNSFHIYKKRCVPNARFLDFRDDIVRTLLEIRPEIEGKDLVSFRKIHDRRKRPEIGANQAPVAPVSSADHWPVKIPVPPDHKRKSLFRKCRNCTKNKLRHETNYMCGGCPQQPPLCPECFREWHTREETGA